MTIFSKVKEKSASGRSVPAIVPRTRNSFLRARDAIRCVRRMSYYHSRLFNEDQCLQRLFELRFPRVRCPECGRRNSYHRQIKKQCFTCNCGKSHIFPRKGTIFGASHLPLLTWIHGIFLLTKSTKDITIRELANDLNIAYPTAWRMKTMIVDILGVRAMTKRSNLTFDAVMKKCAQTVVAET